MTQKRVVNSPVCPTALDELARFDTAYTGSFCSCAPPARATVHVPRLSVT